MAKIKGKNTKPELIVRSYLTKNGVKYRCNIKDLPGKPDIAIKKYLLALEVRGCFWHGHEDCAEFRIPKSRTKFWEEKINSNKVRDTRNMLALKELGFSVCEIWECEIKSGNLAKVDEFIRQYRGIKGT